MAYKTDAHTMPLILTGAEGEIDRVYQWPLSSRQLRRLGWKNGMHGATDCIIAFDQIRAGGAHNVRRVFYDGHFYIKYHRARNGIVRIKGALMFDVFECVTTVYYAWDYDKEGKLKESC